MKRLCICTSSEIISRGGEYLKYYLQELKKFCEKVIVVVNESLTSETYEKLKNYDIIYEKCPKNDFYSWKSVINKIGYDLLSDYDELILTNDSCYGPFYPLYDVFNKMENEDCDFWGITKYPERRKRILFFRKTISEHLQSYFLVCKKELFLSKYFKYFWKKVKINKLSEKYTNYYETLFTEYFLKKGFKSASYIPLYKNINPIYMSYLLLKNEKLPLIKKEYFYNHKQILKESISSGPPKALNFIKKNTEYDINFIYEDLLKNQKMSNIQKTLHLNYIFTDKCENENNYNPKTALIMNIYYPELVDYCYKYATSMPEYADLYLVTSRNDTKELIEHKFKNLPNKTEIRLKPNRGRDLSAFLIACKDVFENYELVCCMHDKKTDYNSLQSGKDFCDICFECNLRSRGYVNNVISLFMNSPKIGLLCPLPVEFSRIVTIGKELVKCENPYKQLYDILNLQIPFDNHPIAPYGSMFWIRGKAIKPLFRHKWDYEDFPEEPMPITGTISHGIERIFSSVAQEAGYFTAYVSPTDYASVYTDNLIQLYSKFFTK